MVNSGTHERDGRGGVSAQTRLLAVLGDPVRHSLSPTFQNAALRSLGLDFIYVAFRVRANDLARALDGLAVLGARGVNLTVPLKEAAKELVGWRSPEVASCGAVNTIVFDVDGRRGYNTDLAALCATLEQRLAIPVGGMPAPRILVLGAGGAGRAAAAALADRGCQVGLAARRPSQAEAAVHELLGIRAGRQVEAVGWRAEETAARGPWEAVVNATPVGLPGVQGELPVSERLLAAARGVLDTTYRQDGTDSALLATARRLGVAAVDGRYMLVAQGAAAFQLFTGRAAPVAEMLQAVGLR
ncbi:MAG: shikimate dehydrogenase [Candidatus Schekmanbacteria bacterium]|nr:shikimate dehydrogenase [Candidatus Schekmanbacteria bacterium]